MPIRGTSALAPSPLRGAPVRPGRPTAAPEQPAPRLRVVEAPAPRRLRLARPRLAHVVVLVAGVAAILLGQLLLSIAVADGAYTIAELQSQQKGLLREQAALQESLDALSSPQRLSTEAERLGMVTSGTLPYLDLSSGASSGVRIGGGGSVLGGSGAAIGNVALDGAPAVDPSDGSSSSALASGWSDAGASLGAGSDATPVSSVTADAPPASGESTGSSGTLPSPVTR